jgi:hypothetical protein
MDVDLHLGLAVFELEQDFLLLDRVEEVVEIRCSEPGAEFMEHAKSSPTTGFRWKPSRKGSFSDS